MTNALQLTLTSPEDFQPVPVGTGHYVAALQTKKGEFDALITASAQTWAHLTPLIEIVGPRSPRPESRAGSRRWPRRSGCIRASSTCSASVRITPPP